MKGTLNKNVTERYNPLLQGITTRDGDPYTGFYYTEEGKTWYRATDEDGNEYDTQEAPRTFWTVTTSDHRLQSPMSKGIHNRATRLTADEAVKMFAEYCANIDTGTVQIWRMEEEAGHLCI